MKPRTLNAETAAAAPGRLTPTRAAYARFFGRSTPHQWALHCSTFLPYPLRHFFSLSRAGVPHWLEIKEHLEHGCLCPARVVDFDSGLVATFTNLNARDERTIPALKVTRAPLHLLPPRLRRDGALLACASVYHADDASWEAGYWIDFSPLPVDCLVPDEAACEGARRRLSQLAWEALDIAIPQLGEKFQAGLHHVSVPHDVVWNAF